MHFELVRWFWGEKKNEDNEREAISMIKYTENA